MSIECGARSALKGRLVEAREVVTWHQLSGSSEVGLSPQIDGSQLTANVEGAMVFAVFAGCPCCYLAPVEEVGGKHVQRQAADDLVTLHQGSASRQEANLPLTLKVQRFLRQLLGAHRYLAPIEEVGEEPVQRQANRRPPISDQSTHSPALPAEPPFRAGQTSHPIDSAKSALQLSTQPGSTAADDRVTWHHSASTARARYYLAPCYLAPNGIDAPR